MRRLVISLAAAGAAIVAASAANAQYYPGPQNYGGYNGYGYQGYGYNNYGGARTLQARLNAVQWRIEQLARYSGDNWRTNQLRQEARRTQLRLRAAAAYGLNPYEANDLGARIERLEQQVQYASAYGGYGYNGRGYDRDHEGDRRWGRDRDDDDGDD